MKINKMCFCLLLLTSCNSSNESINSIKEQEKYIEDDSFKKIPLLVANRVLELDSYIQETNGNTKAKLFIGSYTQNIYSLTKKSEGVIYNYSLSKSSLVTSENSIYYYNNNVYNGEKDSFKSFYEIHGGINPYSQTIEGFIINEDTILNVKKKENDLVYEIAIDGELAGKYNKIQMKEYGGLKELPTYNNVLIRMYLKDDYTPIKYEVESSYNINKSIIGSTTCIQKYTTTFSNINEKVNIENIDNIKQLLS